MEFLDRIEETNRLKRLLDGKESALGCVYGRRRCGKTRLLRELLAKRKDAVYFLADRSESPLQRERLRVELARCHPVFGSIETPGDWGRLFDLWRELTPSGSVLVLDEFPYLVETSPELASVIQRTVDCLGDSGKKIIVCGSSQRMMQGLVLDVSEPLYGRAKEILKIQPLSYEWTSRAFPTRTPFERFAYWAVFGGVPRYWELVAEDDDLRGSIQRHVMSPLGVLHDEPRHLVMDEVSDYAKASTVLALVGTGINRLSEIAARMGRKATEMSHPLKRLQELGLIERQVPFGADEINGKKSVYRLADNFLSFWYAFVAPNLSRPDFLATNEGRAEFEAAFRIYLGGKWEDLVRSRLGGKWCSVSRWWGTGLDRKPMEMDVVAESVDGKTLLVGEAKLALSKREQEHELAALRQKAAALPFRRDYSSVEVRLFVAEAELMFDDKAILKV